MSDYRLFGADTSPYSQKVRSFLRYKNIDFDWVSRSRENEEEFQALARVASVPLLVSPSRSANQDSTAIISALEEDHPEPTAVPDDVATSTLALILEDYADEWLNKIMF
ncbi:MAG TPA: glutathione S-transferase family protein, partial [Hyphomonas sp.]|nr:glutathione S-transferase family protein [Hyphomonas sp.]